MDLVVVLLQILTTPQQPLQGLLMAYISSSGQLPMAIAIMPTSYVSKTFSHPLLLLPAPILMWYAIP